METLGANSNFTLGGSEKYVNSGFILPKGQENGYPGSSNTFTVTFESRNVQLLMHYPSVDGRNGNSKVDAADRSTHYFF